MIHTLRRLILAYPNSAICCCGWLMLLVPFALSASMLSLFHMYEEGTVSPGLMMGVLSWGVNVLRHVSWASWLIGASLIVGGVIRELFYPRPALNFTPPKSRLE